MVMNPMVESKKHHLKQTQAAFHVRCGTMAMVLGGMTLHVAAGKHPENGNHSYPSENYPHKHKSRGLSTNLLFQ